MRELRIFIRKINLIYKDVLENIIFLLFDQLLGEVNIMGMLINKINEVVINVKIVNWKVRVMFLIF